MPSRLTSLLVRDGLIEAPVMEFVFQRQVIDGGALDSILLELGLVPEDKLHQYLSLATGLPPGHGSQIATAPEALELCNQELADKYSVLPTTLRDGALGVMVCEPVNLEKLEGLADELDTSIQPVVVPEYRFAMSHAELFGGEANARFAKIAAGHQGEHAPLASQVPAVTIGERHAHDEDEIDEAPPEPESAPVLERDDNAIPQTIEPESTQPADMSERVRGTRPPEEKPERGQTQEMSVVEASDEGAEAASAEESEAAADDTVLDMPAAREEEQDAPAEEPPAPEPTTIDESVGYSPIRAATCRDLLNKSEDRDEIFVILLRALRRRARHTALFTLKGKKATGRLAIEGQDFDDTEIKKISLPLAAGSAFEKVVGTKAFHVGGIESGDEELDAALREFGGGQIPKSALLLPIVLKDRVIAIAVAHNGGDGVSVARVTELLPLGNATADAFSRLLAKMRAQKEQAASESSPSPSETVKMEAAPAPEESSNALMAPDPEMVALFEKLEGDDEKAANEALEDALSRKKDTLAHLFRHFPGKLKVDRQESKEQLTASEYGKTLELVIKLGAAAGELLAEQLHSADRECRYYASVCALELRPPEAINEMVERLFDGDQRIRDLAVATLAGYPEDQISSALDFARRALHSEDNERLKLASEGLARLADTQAIPDLIDAHSRGGEASEYSRKALFEITNQDFGNSTRKWRGWWSKNQDRNRIEWMLEGLGHKNADVRKSAAETLHKITGEYFGYSHDLPKKEREKARKQWNDWWHDSGKERFDAPKQT